MARRRLIAAALLLVGCGQPRIDTSTDQAMQSSMQEVRESLPESRRAEFDAAVQTLTFSQINLAEIFATGKTPDPNKAVGDLKTVLSGRTAQEVIAAADRVVAAQKAKEREQALAEIRELLKEREVSDAARQELAKFEVLRSRFSVERDYFGMREPKVYLRVRNGTRSPVSRAYFVGKIVSPGRSVPWLQEDFNYTIPGGLEPGEEAEWHLAPNQFSAWGTVEAPADAGLVVTLTRLDGPDGQEVLSVQEFTEEDAARLAALQKQYGQP